MSQAGVLAMSDNVLSSLHNVSRPVFGMCAVVMCTIMFKCARQSVLNVILMLGDEEQEEY